MQQAAEGGQDEDEALDRILSQTISFSEDYVLQKDAVCDRFTRLYLRALLAHTRGNKTVAARLAGLDRSYFNRLLARHRLTAPAESTPPPSAEDEPPPSRVSIATAK